MSLKIIDRTGAEVLIPEERSQEILAAVPEQSIAMRLMRRLPDMSSKTRAIPVASSLPTAEFINGDTGLKPTTDMAWDNVKLTAEEIATIVVIPENVLNDSDYDIWANVLPRINEAIGAAFDKAVLFGTDKPASFPAGIVAGAAAAGNTLALDGSESLYLQLLGEEGLQRAPRPRPHRLPRHGPARVEQVHNPQAGRREGRHRRAARALLGQHEGAVRGSQ